ncbi:cytochrome P450 [Copromyces sp. CBS 386.78]|nr:cytochrome P450 [Copromyces sp. CBS 386.78]
MIFSNLPSYTWVGLGVFLLLLLHAATNYFNHGLNKYPGPFLASLTNWWRFFLVSGQKCQETHIKLHSQLGNVVRLGPNCLSFADPQAAKVIYSLKNNLNKSTFYPVQMQLHRGVPLPSLFGTLDNTYHSRLRRLATPAFAMSNLVTHYEPRVDNAIRTFLSQTAKLYASTCASDDEDEKTTCNLVRWLQFFAFDVIAEITYSKRLGFIDREEDVDGIIESLDNAFDYSAVVGQMPWLDRWVGKQNPIKRMLSRWGVWQSTSAPARFARERMVERLEQVERKRSMGDNNKTKKEEGGGRAEGDDLMGMFLQAQRDDQQQGSGFMTDHVVLTMATTMVLAGSDTTAASLAAVFYYLLRNEACYRRLVREIDDAVAEGVISLKANHGVVSWADAQKLPYLDACIKEAFRLHPAVGMHLERVTPPGGMDICGEFVPGGTIVGCNAWVVHRSREIFGEDTDEYRPERWLVDENLDQETEKQRVSEMNATLLHFGAGIRGCIGRNIALLEMYKFVPSFLRRFDIQPTTGKEWPCKNMWFIKPVKLDVGITARAT